jgi:hypothetical protein
MPLVFVHGVNNRRGNTPEEQQVFDNATALLREQFAKTAFAERVVAPENLAVFTPYWGDLGVTFARNLACLPQSGVQALTVGQPPEYTRLTEATASSLDAETLRQPGVQNAPLLTLARTRSLGAAVDLLFAGAAQAPVPGLLMTPTDLQKSLPDVAQLADAAERYAAANPKPAWLAQVADDDAFVDRLVKEATAFSASAAVAPGAPEPSVQALGIGSNVLTWLGNGAAAVRNAVGAVAGAASHAVAQAATTGTREGFLWFSGFVRPTASTFIGRFIGDVFTYLDDRQPIINRVLTDVDKAVAAKRPGDEELYLVGHSFGGIILYDILLSPA